MTPEERVEIERPVRLIQDERDHKRFLDVVVQLNEILDRKERRLDSVNKAG